MKSLLIVLLVLAGCSAGAAKPGVASVAATEAALAAAGRAVLACYAVPACAAVAPKSRIKVAYDSAYGDLAAAQTVADAGGSPDMTASAAAMTELQGLVAQLPAIPASSGGT